MSQPSRRAVERVLDPAYRAGLTERTLDEIRAMREEVREVENEISFERRLCQARIDILGAEMDRREGRSAGDLVARLPEILADAAAPDTASPLPSRAPDMSMPRSADVPRRRIEEVTGEEILGRIGTMTDAEIQATIHSLREHEEELSAKRHDLHEVIDAIQTEVGRRYRDGEADPAEALGL